MSAGRTGKVAIGIGVVSAAVGALLALLPAALLVTTLDGPRALLAPALYASTMPVGAICGAVLAPVAAFGFMRRVPLAADQRVLSSDRARGCLCRCSGRNRRNA